MIEAIIAATGIALLSLIGVFLFGGTGHMTGSHRYVLPAAVGTFLGIVFFELIPETLHEGGESGSIAIAVGFLSFYLLARFLDTYHHHHHPDHCEGCATPQSAQMLLIGDGVHNIADGIVIASAFLVNPAVGIATTVGVALHEIPQEIAEFGVLRASGYSRGRAAFLNLLSASSIILGVVLTFIFASFLGDSVWILTGLAAGNLLYIAATDLLPELNSDHSHHFWETFLSTVAGLIFIALLLSWTHEQFGEEHEEEMIRDSLASQTL